MVPHWTVHLFDAHGAYHRALVQADHAAEAADAGRHDAEMSDILSPVYGRAWDVIAVVSAGVV